MLLVCEQELVGVIAQQSDFIVGDNAIAVETEHTVFFILIVTIYLPPDECEKYRNEKFRKDFGICLLVSDLSIIFVPKMQINEESIQVWCTCRQ